jgi:hypothetical protein
LRLGQRPLRTDQRLPHRVPAPPRLVHSAGEAVPVVAGPLRRDVGEGVEYRIDAGDQLPGGGGRTVQLLQEPARLLVRGTGNLPVGVDPRDEGVAMGDVAGAAVGFQRAFLRLHPAVLGFQHDDPVPGPGHLAV